MNSNTKKSKAINKSLKKIYDDIILKVRRDAKINGDYIRAHATSRGESMNGFFKRAIMETIEQDKKSIE